MSASNIVVAVVGVLLIISGIAGMAFLVWITVRSELRRRHNQRERLLSDARLQMHTHEAMGRLYEVARQVQMQRRPDRGSS